jgi:hypothetical protein
MLKPSDGTFIIENMTAKSDKSKIRKSKSQDVDEIQAAIDYGIDISMLIQNMSRG